MAENYRSHLAVLIYAILVMFPRPNHFALANHMRKVGDMPILIAYGGNREFPVITLVELITSSSRSAQKVS